MVGATIGSEVASGEVRHEHSERKREGKKINGRREDEKEKEKDENERKRKKMGKCGRGGKRWVLKTRRRKIRERGKYGEVWLWWKKIGLRVCFLMNGEDELKMKGLDRLKMKGRSLKIGLSKSKNSFIFYLYYFYI